MDNKLKYATKKKYIPKEKLLPKIQAVDVIYTKMVFYETKAVKLQQKLINLAKYIQNTKEIPLFDKIKTLGQQLIKYEEIVLDCAHKLAPYQSAKLQSLEVKSKVEHRMVIRAPAPQSMEEFMKLTGATKLTPEEAIIKKAPPKSIFTPSIHDFDDSNDEDDPDKDNLYIEPGMIN